MNNEEQLREKVEGMMRSTNDDELRKKVPPYIDSENRFRYAEEVRIGNANYNEALSDVLALLDKKQDHE